MMAAVLLDCVGFLGWFIDFEVCFECVLAV